MKQTLKARRLQHTAEGLAGSLRALGVGTQPSFWNSLFKVQCPTLLLVGQRDAKFSKIAQRMAQQMPQCWVRAFAGVGHVPHLECPDEYALEIRTFLAASQESEQST
jgi:2-succinyl-6-hydroxy-2,4-cyclohexadiene-1-carboxylate synthase